MDTEVTNKMYRDFLEDVTVTTSDTTFTLLPDSFAIINDLWLSEYYDYFRDERFDNYPVVGLEQLQMKVYAAWLSAELPEQSALYSCQFRLPTKSEWQYAALGGRSPENYYALGGIVDTNSRGNYLYNSFSYGVKKSLGIENVWQISSADINLLDSAAKMNELLFILDYKFWRRNSESPFILRHPILSPNKAASGFPNDFGLYNMCGNVAEMTSDTFVMGGSFKLESHYMRIAKDRFPYPYKKNKPQSDMGFRLVCDYKPCKQKIPLSSNE